MDQLRRALVIGLPSLATVPLLGCQDADGNVPGASALDVAQERAQLAGLQGPQQSLIVSSTDGSPLSAQLGTTGEQSTLAFKPDLSLTPACLFSKGSKMSLRLHQAMPQGTEQTLHRTLSLTLGSNSALRHGTILHLGKSGAVSGRFMVHSEDGDGQTFVTANTGYVRLLSPIMGSQFRLQFNRVRLINPDSEQAIALDGVLTVRYVIEEKGYAYG
jgi:hypothetical protein